MGGSKYPYHSRTVFSYNRFCAYMCSIQDCLTRRLWAHVRPCWDMDRLRRLWSHVQPCWNRLRHRCRWLWLWAYVRPCFSLIWRFFYGYDQGESLSVCTFENVRYRLGESPHAEHVNEDRWFDVRGGRCQVMALFDGHDGPRAMDHVCRYVGEQVEKRKGSDMRLATLRDMFIETDSNFFGNISAYTEEKQTLEAVIPPVSTFEHRYFMF